MNAKVKDPVLFDYAGNEKPVHRPRKCVIIDLDGTLLNNKHRQHHMVGEKKNWKAFFEAMGGDSIVEEVRFLVKLIFTHTDLGVILATGRPSQYSAQTLASLVHHSVPYTMLMMRAEGDGTSDATCKKHMLRALRDMGWDPMFAIDDRPEVVAMWRANGVPVLQPDATDWYKQQTVESPLLESLEMVRTYAAQLPECEEANHIRNHTIAIGAHIDTLTHTIREQRDELERLRS